jgi:tellurite resistance protein
MDTMQQVELLRAACCIAGADGRITDAEREAVDRLADHCGAGSASVNAMLDLAMNDPRFIDKQLKSVGDHGETIIRLLCKVAQLDGGVSPEERALLERFADKVEIAHDIIDDELGG